MILEGDCLNLLATLNAESVHCCVTSPPYWALRDYGVFGQLGLETTPEEYIEKMVLVFREVKRVLRKDGTLWLNIGDSYLSSGGAGWQGKHSQRENRRHTQRSLQSRAAREIREGGLGLKPKDMVGIPWMLAFALRADGWYLRQDIIWHKPNPMPESIQDRCTKAHEYLFLLTREPRYYFDSEAISEPCSPDTHARYARGRSEDHKWAGGGPGNQTIARGFDHMRAPGVGPKAQAYPSGWGKNGEHHSAVEHSTAEQHPKVKPRQNESFSSAVAGPTERRNKRSVWTVVSEGYAGAHFATYPTELIKPCILAGCPPGGTVLDPFTGAGTTWLVADRLQRQFVGIELNPEYAALARERVRSDAPLFFREGS